jgi:outer membrane lipoprotein SlyB
MRFLQCASDKMETTMENTTTKSMHPLTAIAAISVTLFSLAGIGAITGLIPTSQSQSTPAQATAPAAEPVKAAAATPPAETVAAPAPASVKPAAAHKPAAKPVKAPAPAAKPAEEHVAAVKTEAPVQVAQNVPPPPGAGVPPDYQAPPKVEAPKPICHECGVIESVREVEKKGEGSGVGAVAGGVAGGVLGHQTGGGRGKDVMTLLGAIGGAVAGHEIEKNVKKVKSYEVAIRFEDGSSRLISQDNPPAWRQGDKVKVVNGMIAAMN